MTGALDRPLKHQASIDLEDWYADVECAHGLSAAQSRQAFDRQLESMQSVLDSTDTRCTFFVLGKTAERFPHWVRHLHDRGHEIASHGYGHGLVRSLSPAAFADDLDRSIDVLAGLTGRAPVGYRAPYFSVSLECSWFYEALAARGFRYSSSVYPCRGMGYGIPNHPLGPQVRRERHGSLIEFPLSVLELAGLRMPIAGGGSWRLFPAALIDWGVSRLERSGRRFAMYLHPHEFDPVALRSDRGWRRDIYVNLGRASVPETLRLLLSRHDFGTFLESLD